MSSESSLVMLQGVDLPKREVHLSDISIHNLPLNWEALLALGKAINRLQDVPLNGFDISAQIKANLKPELYQGIPAISSAIAHHYNPDIPILKLNTQEVEGLKPIAGIIRKLLKQIRPQWGQLFENFAQKKAAEIISQTAHRVCVLLDDFGSIENLEDQFFLEVKQLYLTVIKPRYETSDDFFNLLFGGSEQVRVPIEKVVEELLYAMESVSYGPPTQLINPSTYPLLTKLLRTTKFPPRSLNKNHAAIAGSEMVEGIEKFLRSQGLSEIGKPPPPTMGFMRFFAEIFASEKMATVKMALPQILEQIKNFLPESSPETIKAIQTLAENILILSQQGYTGQQIGQALVAKNTTAP